MAIKIRTGYELTYSCPQPTPMILTLSVHPSRRRDLLTPDKMQVQPLVAATEYLDDFGNICHVVHAPSGQFTISSDFLIEDSGAHDEVAPDAQQISLEKLPVETLGYLLGSRYCETDRLGEFAWATFGKVPKGWPLVQAICRLRARPHHLRLRSTPTRPRPRTTPSRKSTACAATSPISPSRFAAA